MRRHAHTSGCGWQSLRSILLPLRVAAAVALAVVGWTATHPLAGYAEPVATEEQHAGDRSADDSSATASAGNGGTALSTSGGEVEIGEIVTGENTGNTIITGNISGSAEISGGEIDYPTDVDVSLNNSPLLADASGGDSNEASATDNADGGANEDGDAATDIKVINKNDNRSSAVITTEPSP